MAHIKFEIRGYLVVAASARVDFFAEVADAFCQNPLYRHVNIFVCRQPKIFPCTNVGANGFQSFADFCLLRSAQTAGFHHTFSVSERALNILFQKFLVEIQTEAEIYHALSHAAIKATVPHHFFAVFLGHVKSSFLHKDKKSEFSRWDWAGERERLMVLNGKKIGLCSGS